MLKLNHVGAVHHALKVILMIKEGKTCLFTLL